MPVLLGGLELQKHCCYFISLEGLEPLWPEIFRLAFKFFACSMSGQEGSHANKQQGPHSCHLSPPPPQPSHHRDTEMSGRPCQGPGGKHEVGYNLVPTIPSCAPGLTLAFKLLGRRGEEQFCLPCRRPSAAGSARFLVACASPSWQPAQVAVTVQGGWHRWPWVREERGQTLQLHGVPHPLGTRYQTLCPELAEP